MNILENLAVLVRLLVELLWYRELAQHTVPAKSCLKLHSDITCSESSVFRTADGTCNNLRNPLWGAANQPFPRLLLPKYDSVSVNISVPRIRARNGAYLPSARLVSEKLHGSDSSQSAFKQFTNMHQTWGQFLDHDLSHTPKSENTIDCCEKFNKYQQSVTTYNEGNEPSFPIPIPSNDRYFRNKTCMNFVRSQHFPCPGAAWQQMNIMTSYIDASMVYGADLQTQNSLRTLTDGMLRTTKEDLLPNTTNAQCQTIMMVQPKQQKLTCFNTGDIRASEHPALSTLHIVFVRLHNVIAGQLKTFNTDWNDGRLFQETRKIVGAIVQIITYKEFLPLLLGDSAMKQFNLDYNSSYSYEDTRDATILNEFASAAFRYGHSQVPSSYTIGKDSIPLQDMFNRPSFIQRDPDKVNGILHGLLKDVSQKADRFFSLGITDHLFEQMNDSLSGLDLAAINIQRGRDHGLPPYNDYREKCGQPRIRQPGTNLTNDQTTVQKFLSVYSHIDDVDLFTGSLSETPVSDAMIGPTFICIIADCFRSLKFGDRFWYQNRKGVAAFTSDQILELQKITLSKVLCETSAVANIQISSFKTASTGNPLVPCSQLPMIDLSKWRDLL